MSLREEFYSELDELSAQVSQLRGRSQEKAELEQRISDLVFAEYSPEYSPEKCELIWTRAWAEGHSTGYHTVAMEYAELVSWLKEVEALG